MLLESLELFDVRNYAHAHVSPDPGVVLFSGANAQGKTNLLEAIHYLAIGSSHRASSDAVLVRHGAEHGVVRARARRDGGQRVEVAVQLGAGRTLVSVNGQAQRRARDGLGVVRSVLVAPEDLNLVRGDPAIRRRFLDDLLALRRPAYAQARLDFERVLRQRNALLKEVRARRVDAADVPTWTQLLVQQGARLQAARMAAVHALTQPLVDAYADLVAASPEHDQERLPRLAYLDATGRRTEGDPQAGVPEVGEVAAALERQLQGLAAEERQRGITLAGPHRDDLALDIGPLPAKGYASHGEQWSLALALRLASHRVLAEVGDEPIVLLDDVFAELDHGRRLRLARRCEVFPQVLVTAAVAEEVPLGGQQFRVHAGTVQAA